MIRIAGTQITASHEGQTVTRHASFFKKIPPVKIPPPIQRSGIGQDDIEICEPTETADQQVVMSRDLTPTPPVPQDQRDETEPAVLATPQSVTKDVGSDQREI